MFQVLKRNALQLMSIWVNKKVREREREIYVCEYIKNIVILVIAGDVRLQLGH